MPKLTLVEWREKVGGLPPLIEHFSYDLFCEGRAPANAVAEAVQTLDHVSRKGENAYGGKVPFRTRHAAEDAVAEWESLEFLEGQRSSLYVPGRIMRSLDEAADSMMKATVHEPVGKPGGPGLWKHKGMQLPAYIQHIANDLREKRGMTESRAIATAIAAVKRWAAGGGKVDPGTRAAAAKAVAEWERLKAQAHATKAVKRATEAKLVRAVARLKHMSDPIPDQRSFAVRYANRLTLLNGTLSALRDRKPLALGMAAQLLEADAETPVERLIEELQTRRDVMMVLMEALGYGATPIRAREGKKGAFHGMHGTERAVRKRTHGPEGESHPVKEVLKSGGRLTEAAVAFVQPTGAAFEEMHPRAVHGQFGQKGGTKPEAGAKPGAAPAAAGNASALAAAIQASDPQFQKDMAATSAYARTHTPGAASQTMAGEQIQSIGYSNDPAGIAQFQKDEGMKVTGRLDGDTLSTIATVYSQNSRYAAGRVPDFTGIPGAGARVTGGRISRGGRRTLGKTTAAKVNEALAEADLVVASSRSGAPILFGPPPGTNHANEGPEGGPATRQPGGDDFDLDEPPKLPPNLRESGGGPMACASCVHFSPKGWVTSRNIQGACLLWTWPVDRLDVCDDWLTLTPPDAPLRVQEVRLAEATAEGDPNAIVAARAAVRVLRERYPDTVELPHPANEWLFEALALGELVLQERSIGTEKRKALAQRGQTLKGGTGYPIENLSDLSNAVQAWGRAKPADRPALKRLLLKMARKLNAGQDTIAKIRGLTVNAQAA